MADERTLRLGALLEHLHYDAMDAWRSKYARELTLADLLGGPLACIEDQVVTWPGGRVQLTSTLHARRRHETEAYFVRAQRRGPAEYVITGSSLTLS